MKTSADSGFKFQSIQAAGLYLLAAVVPLIIFKGTFSHSDLPKSTALIITTGLFVLLSAIAVLFSKNSKELKWKFVPLTDIPVIILFLAVLLSFIFSINHYNSYYGSYERQIGLLTYIILFLVYFFASTLNWNKKNISRLCLVMESAAFIVALNAVLQQLGLDLFELQPHGYTRPVSFIGNAVFAGGFLAIVLPISALNLSGKKNQILRYLIPLVILTGIIVTRTRSAYIAVAAEAVIGITAAFIFYDKKILIKRIILMLAVILLFAAAFIILIPENIFSARIKSFFDAFNNPRWLIWRDALGVFYKYPVTGPGPGNFPLAFSEFYSYSLRYDDLNRYVDNAHNNYLQILCTMGIISLTGYLSVITGAVLICIRKITEYRKEKITGNLFFYSALLLSFTGYIFYGLTNFDDLSIMLYFTLLLILVRSCAENKSVTLKLNRRFKAVFVIIMLPVIVFLGYNINKSLEHFIADTEFLKGQQMFRLNRFKEGINLVNYAIYTWQQNPVYRYAIAAEVYRYTVVNKIANEEIRSDLLKQAAAEIIKAKVNHSNPIACDALLSLIYFEYGNTDEAERLKTEVLNKDKINIEYRINLSNYYLKNKQFSKSLEQIEEIKTIGYQSVKFWYLQALYYDSIGNKTESLKFAERILENEPYNKDAEDLKRKLSEIK